MYFLHKFYAEFVMGKHVNYFDMLGFQGVGMGMPQRQPHARHRDANPQIRAPRAQLPRADIPPAHDMVAQTQEAFLTLAEMVSQHTTTIDQRAPSSSAGVQTPDSSGGGISIGGDIPISHLPQSEPHVCTSCGGPCYGPAPRHGTTTMTGRGQVRTLLKLYYCSIFNFSILYVTQ